MCKEYPVIKIRIDEDDCWSDMVSFYKSKEDQSKHRVRIRLLDRPVVDTGGVRRQMFTQTFRDVRLFEGPLNDLITVLKRDRQVYFKSWERWLATASSKMESVFLPLCYDYIAKGEQHAMQNCSLGDVNAGFRKVLCVINAYNYYTLPRFLRLHVRVT